jgi:hypothetical protein
VSDFLTNLALRAAGVVTVASPEIPPAPWSGPPDPAGGLEELVQEEVAPLSPSTEPREDHTPPGRPRLREAERVEVAAPTPIPDERKAQPHPRPAPTVPERIREVQTEHHGVVRESADVRPIEVHETIREKEIVREKVVERELSAEAPPPKPRIVSIPPAVPATPRRHDVEPVSNEVTREVVVKTPVPMPQPALLPAPPEEIVLPPRRTEPVAELTPQKPPAEDVKTLLRPRESTPPAARVAPPPPAVTVAAKTAAAEFRVPTKPAAAKPLAPSAQTPGVTPEEPVLRPAPLPEPVLGSSAERTKPPAREKAVEVRIGSIEIRTAAPVPQPKSPEPVSSREPLEGFEAYRSLRRYSAWFRE